MHRTLTILRYSFLEAVLQPIFSLLLAIGAIILIVFACLPFFAFGEDTKMYKSVGLDVIMLLVLLATLFSTSKSIFEEIEDRTMLTLMSKPVRRWEVVVGKYLGIILSSAVGVATLGLILMLCTYFRIPSDYMLRNTSLAMGELQKLHDYRWMHLVGLVPSLILTWLQISVLAAIGVALSVRFSLVVNLPVVIILYIGGNLSRFLFPLDQGPLMGKPIAQAFAWVATLVLPFLQVLDIRDMAVMGVIRVAGTAFYNDPKGVSISTLVGYCFVATLYAIAYATMAISAGLWMFQNRELGGGEG